MRLTDILLEDHIQIPLKAENRDDSIKKLLQLLDKNKMLSDFDQAYQAILDREKLMTTGVGNNVAIPHCKHNSCPNFAVALGVQNQGVDFSSVDRKKAKIIFLLVGPENNPGMHIKLLSRISRLMSNDELRQHLLNCKNPAEILRVINEEEDYYFDLD